MKHCCEQMKYFSSLNCVDHKDIYQCPDVLVSIQQNQRHGLIIHDGGSSQIEIHYCPWCGEHLEKKGTTQERTPHSKNKAMKKLKLKDSLSNAV